MESATVARRSRWHTVLLLGALGLGLLVLAVVVCKKWLTSSTDPTERHPAVPQRPAMVAPGVYMANLNPSAVYVIDTPDGLAFVDSGLDPEGKELTHLLDEWGFDLSRLRLILLTHAHGDHTLGAEHFRDVTGAKVYAGKGDCDVLRAGGPREAFFANYAMRGHDLHATHVDVALSGGEVITQGDVRIQALALPGHTPGSVCYLMERDGQRILFTGDVISSLTSELGTYSARLSPKYRGDAKAYIASLRELRKMEVPDRILVGHPKSEVVPDTRQLTPEQWKELLDRGIRELEGKAGR
jgi:glyoxylase-like metal-dependent hydrolase (beta-lactamase superfamily II)